MLIAIGFYAYFPIDISKAVFIIPMYGKCVFSGVRLTKPKMNKKGA